MCWSYKTVRFHLKKEGILSSAFLDESEIEMSLNEFGKVGWELVSFVEVQEGLMAIFKMYIGKVRETNETGNVDKKRVVMGNVLQSFGLEDTETTETGTFDSKKTEEQVNTQTETQGIELKHIASKADDTDVGAIRIE